MPLWRAGKTNLFASFGLVVSRFPEPQWQEIMEGWRFRPRKGIILPPGALMAISRGPRPGGGWKMIAAPGESVIVSAEGDAPVLLFLTPRGLYGREVRVRPLEERLRRDMPSIEEIRAGAGRLIGHFENWAGDTEEVFLRHVAADDLTGYDVAGLLLGMTAQDTERTLLDLLARLQPWP